MKKLSKVFLAFALFLNTSLAYAEVGDIIHLGNGVKYKKGDSQAEEIFKDIENLDTKLYYRVESEIPGQARKYINISDQEKNEEEIIGGYLLEVEKDPDKWNEVLSDKVHLSEIKKRLEKGKIEPSEFASFSSGTSYTEDHFYPVIPEDSLFNLELDKHITLEKGSKENTVKIKTFTTDGKGAKRTMDISDTLKTMDYDKVVNGPISYRDNIEVEIKQGQYINFYGTNLSGNLKSFASIKIDDKYINIPRKKANGNLDLSEISISPVNGKANMISIRGLKDKEKVVYGIDKNSSIFIDGLEDIQSKVLTEVGNLTLDLPTYNYFIVIEVEDNEILSYGIKEVKASDYNKSVPKLDLNVSLEKGNTSGEVKIKLPNGESFLVASEIPVESSEIQGTSYEGSTSLDLGLGSHYVIVLDSSEKIKGYVPIEVKEENIRGIKLSEEIIAVNSEVGSGEGSIKLNFPDSDNYYYKLLKEKENSIFEDSNIKDGVKFTSNTDIKVKADSKYILLYKKEAGKIVEYFYFELTENNVNIPAELMILNQDYGKFIPGSGLGQTKIDNLKEGYNFYYKLLDERESAPQKASSVAGYMSAGYMSITKNQDITIETDENKLRNYDENKKTLRLVGAKNEKIERYADITIEATSLNLPAVGSISPASVRLVKGENPNTSKVESLMATGNWANTKFTYEILPKNSTLSISEISVNSKRSGRSIASGGIIRNVDIGDKLLIVEKDGEKSKNAIIITLTETMVRRANAKELQENKDYSKMLVGDGASSVKFENLTWENAKSDGRVSGENLSIKVYLIDKEDKNLELDSPISWDSSKGEKDLKIVEVGGVKTISNIEAGKYLLLTIEDGIKLKAFKYFKLEDTNIRGEDLDILPSSQYELSKGSEPSTTKFSKLDNFGVSNGKFIYTLSKNQLVNKPYKGQRTEDVAGGKSVTEKTNITVSKRDGNYGYINLYLVDGSKLYSYASIKIEDSMVLAHASINANIKFASPSTIEKLDHVKISGPSKLHYGIFANESQIRIPGVDGELPRNLALLPNDGEIPAEEGQYVLVIEEENEKVKSYNVLEIRRENIKRTKVEFLTTEILQTDLRNNGMQIGIKLETGKWSDELFTNRSVADEFFKGFNTSNQPEELAKLLEGRGLNHIAKNSDSQITVFFKQAENYNLLEEQEIGLKIPASALRGSSKAVVADNFIKVKPTSLALISGEITSKNKQSDIRKGDPDFIIIELDKSEFKLETAGSSVGLSETSKSGIKNSVKSNKQNSPFVDLIKSNKVNVSLSGGKNRVKISLLENDVSISEEEQITFVLDESLIVDGREKIYGDKSLSIRPDNIEPNVEVSGELEFEAPDFKRLKIASEADTIKLKLKNGKFANKIDGSNILISLPKGLRAQIKRIDDENLEIKFSGNLTEGLASKGQANIQIKKEAILGDNYLDGNTKVNLIKEASILEDLKKVSRNVLARKLEGTSDKMEYSLDSTNGSNGTWKDADQEKTINLDFKAGKTYVRDKNNIKVFYEVGSPLKLENAPSNLKIDEVIYTEDKVEITLANTNRDYDYSIDSGKTWQSMAANIKIGKTAVSEIRIRYSATKDKLYSNSQNLNFINLLNVEMNLNEKMLKNITSNVEYGFGTTFKKANPDGQGIERNVEFQSGRLILRDSRNHVNTRELGPITTVENNLEIDKLDLIINENKASYDQADIQLEMIITDNIARDIYSSKWLKFKSDVNQMILEKDDGLSFKEGTVYIRPAGQENVLPGNLIEVRSLYQREAPEVNVDNKNRSITHSYGNQLEMRRFGGETWLSDASEVLNFQNRQVVEFRLKADGDNLSSKIYSYEFVENMKLDVRLNLEKGEILNLNDKVEYSTNSTNGIDGNWVQAKNGENLFISKNRLMEDLHLLEGNKVWVRQVEDKVNKKSSEVLQRNLAATSNLLEMDYSKNIVKALGSTDIKLGNKNWQKATLNQEFSISDLKGGDFILYRNPSTSDKIYSVEQVAYEIPYPGETPTVTLNATLDGVEEIDGSIDFLGFEYRITSRNEKNWKSAETLKDMIFITDETIEIRRKASSSTIPSGIKEIKFLKKINLNGVTVDKHANPISLIGTETEMSYYVRLVGEADNPTWIKASKGRTLLNGNIKLSDIVSIKLKDNRKEATEHEIFINIDNLPESLENIIYSLDHINKKIIIKDNTNSTTAASDLSSHIEYRFNGGTWGRPELPYEAMTLEIRDKRYPAQVMTKVINRREKPVVKLESVKYLNNSRIILEFSGINSNVEYTMNTSGNYSNIPSNNKFNIGASEFIKMRAKGNESHLPSLETDNLNKLENLSELHYDHMEGFIYGTKTNLEYSITANGETSGKWYTASNEKTSISSMPGLTADSLILVREKANPVNIRLLEKLSLKDKINDADKTHIIYNVKNGTLENKLNEQIEYSLNGSSGPWIKIQAGQKASSIDFKEGPIHIRRARDKNSLASLPVVLYVIPAKESAPNATRNDIKNNIVKVYDENQAGTTEIPAKEYEYKIKGNPHWKPGIYMKDEAFTGDTQVEIRKIATKENLPSQVLTVSFRGYDLNKIWVSTHKDPYELNFGEGLNANRVLYRVVLSDENNLTPPSASDNIIIHDGQWIEANEENKKVYFIKGGSPYKVNTSIYDKIEHIDVILKAEYDEMKAAGKTIEEGVNFRSIDKSEIKSPIIP